MRALLVLLLALLAACSNNPAPERMGDLHNPAQPTGASVVSPATWTANTLAPPVTSPSWRVTPGPLAPSIQPFAGDSTAGYATRGLIWFNRQIAGTNTCPASGYLERPVTMPAGVTGVQLQWDEVQQDADGSSPAFALQLYDAQGLTQVSAASFTPTSTSTNVATSTIAVTAGLEYRVRVNCLTGAHFLAGAFRVRPTVSTNAKLTATSGAWQRLDVDGAVLQDSNEVGYVNPRYAAQSSHSHVELSTNAPWVLVESYDNIGDYIGTGANGNDNLSVFVNGAPLDPPLAPTVGVVSYNAIALTSTTAGGFRRVSVNAGPQALSGLPAPVNENRGSFIAGIYVPTGSITTVLPAERPASGETIEIYGDSKLAGFYSDVPGRDSLVYLLRARGHRVISQAAGGGNLAADVGTTLSSTSASMVAFATKLCRNKPTQLILGIGRNDFTGQTFSPANLETQLVNLVTAFHAACPAALVKVLTFTHETTENAVGGVSWLTMRGDQIGVCSGLSYCSVLYGDGLWTTAEAPNFTADGTHPNSKGHQALSTLIHGVGAYPWTPARLSPFSWCVPELGLTGHAMTAVTSAGTTPPTVTLSGTPAAAFPLRIEITSAGTLGGSIFRWSIDGGRSWATNNLTAASVALGATGITAGFASGTYHADNVYTANTDASGCADASGNGNTFGPSGGTNPTFTQNGINGLPSFVSSGVTYLTATPTIAPPYSFWVVASETSATSLKDLIGRPGSATGVTLYSASTTTMQLIAGGQSLTITPAGGLTIAHSYVGVVVGGGSAGSVLCSDPSAANLCTAFGTAPGSTSITGLAVGYDNANSLSGNFTMAEFGVVAGSLSTDQVNSLGAYLRMKYALVN